MSGRDSGVNVHNDGEQHVEHDQVDQDHERPEPDPRGRAMLLRHVLPFKPAHGAKQFEKQNARLECPSHNLEKYNIKVPLR